MSREKILVVDDDGDIVEFVRYNLEKERFRVVCAASGEEALVKGHEQKPDLIVLDVMPPNRDGLQVCRELKSHPVTLEIPIIMLMAKSEDADIVTGLELGADDYIIKPFSPRMLLAIVKAMLHRRKRSLPGEAKMVKVSDITIDPARFQVWKGDSPVNLSVSEFKILHLLAGHPGWVYSRDQIISAIRGDDYPVTDRSVDVQILGLRKKLGHCCLLIETVRGVGYRFKDEGLSLPTSVAE